MTSEAVLVSARAGYALWAETWDDAGSPIVALEERYLTPWLAELRPRRALDVGCGTGRWTSRLNAVGVDASLPMLDVARRKPGLAGRLAAGEAGCLPIANGAADLLLCTLTLGHIPNPATAIRELGRVLTAGGTLILTDFHPAAAVHGWRRTFSQGERVYELENYSYSLEELREAADGLTLQEHIDATFGLPELRLFERAGRSDLFAAACAIPAVLLTRWTRV